VEGEKHNPKVVRKGDVCGDQGQGDGKEGDASSKQLMDSHNCQKDEFQDQLRTPTPEAMAKNVPPATSHPSYSDFFPKPP
jgi:hypothetical protein